jgi:hypothetical protein
MVGKVWQEVNRGCGDHSGNVDGGDDGENDDNSEYKDDYDNYLDGDNSMIMDVILMIMNRMKTE